MRLWCKRATFQSRKYALSLITSQSEKQKCSSDCYMCKMYFKTHFDRKLQDIGVPKRSECKAEYTK